MSIKLFFLGCLVIFSTSLWGSDEGEFRGETKAKIEILQKQNDELKTKIGTLEKDSQDVEEFKNSITDQDKRIQDLSFYTSLIATLIAILTLIVGAVGVAFPYLMFRQNSKSQEEAKKDIELWKIKTKSEFDAELENFKKIKEEKSLEIKNHTEEAKRKIDGKVQEISNISVGELKQSVVQISIEDEKEIRKESQILSDVAEKENDVEGFITSAKLSYSIQNYGDALRNVEKALNLTKNETEIAQFLFFKGIIFNKLNKVEDEIMVYNEIVTRFSTKKDEIIQVQIANSLHNKGVTLSNLNRDEESIEIYNEIIKRFFESDNAIIQERVADALINKGVKFGTMHRNEEAIDIFNLLLSKFSNTSIEPLQSKVVLCLVNKGYALSNLDKNEEAISIYDYTFDKFKETENDAIREQIANALYNKAVVLGKINKFKESIESYNYLLSIFKSTNDKNIQEIVSKSLINIGLTYSQMNQYSDAIIIFDNLINLFHQTSNNQIKIDIFRAYNSKGFALIDIEQAENALVILNEALEKIYALNDELFDEQKAKLLLNKGYCYGELKRYEEEINTYDTLIALFQFRNKTIIKETVINAQSNKGFRLYEKGDDIAALDVFKQITQEFQNIENKKIQDFIANAYFYIGLIHGRKKRFEESIIAYTKAIEIQPINPETYTNLLEMQLIFLQKLEANTVNKLLEICKDDNQTLLKYYMLKSVHDALLHEQSEKIAELKKEFQDIDFGEWGWAELDDWANNLDDIEAKTRVLSTIEQFKNW